MSIIYTMELANNTGIDNTEFTLTPHSFNITEPESLFFSVKRVHVERAELFIDEKPMAVITGKGEPVDSNVTPLTETSLDFFNGVPLHRALLRCPVRIVIHTFDDDVPELCMAVVDTLTWDHVQANEYVIDVTVASKAGPVEKKMMYTTMYAGYM